MTAGNLAFTNKSIDKIVREVLSICLQQDFSGLKFRDICKFGKS